MASNRESWPFGALLDYWQGIPPEMREPIRSAAVSIAFGVPTAIGTLGSSYFVDHPNDWHGFAAYVASPHAVGAICIAIAAAYRARQGFLRAKANGGGTGGAP